MYTLFTKPEDKDFARYGARGITVCTTWLNYSQFVADMGEPKEGETLDRIDGTKGYFKENCRWASGHIQAVNSKRQTTSGYRGVTYHRKLNKWIASITVHGRRYYSKVYSRLEEAVAARQRLEKAHWNLSL